MWLKNKLEQIQFFKIKEDKYPLEGRLIFYLSDKLDLKFSWNAWSNFTHLKFNIDSTESDVGFSLACSPISFWFSIGGQWIWKLLKSCQDREFSLSYHHQAIWWNLGTNPNDWSNQIPRWRNGSFHLDDFILGPSKFSKQKFGEPVGITLYFSEGSYRGTCQLESVTWKRPRWFKHQSQQASIEMQEPVPIPGKGENSWNCGQEAVHGTMLEASSVSEAIGKFTTSILQSREKYGGLQWNPSH